MNYFRRTHHDDDDGDGYSSPSSSSSRSDQCDAGGGASGGDFEKFQFQSQQIYMSLCRLSQTSNMVRRKRTRRRRRGIMAGGGSSDCCSNNIDVNVVDGGKKMKRENVSRRGGHHQNSIDDDDDDDGPALLSADLILSQKSTNKIRQIPTVLAMRKKKKQRDFSSCYHRKQCGRSHPSSRSLPPHRHHRHFFLVRSCISPKLYALAAALLIVTLTMSKTAAMTTGTTSQEVTTNDNISSRILGDYSRPNQNNDGSMTDDPVIGATNNGGGEEESGDSEDDDYEYSDDPVAAYDDTDEVVPAADADADAVIDCDRFEHLAEEMPQCQDEDDYDHVFNGNGTDTIEAASRPTNEVHFQFDLVVFVPQSFLDERESEKEMMYGLPPRIHKLARLAVATVVSRVLDDLTDYRVVLKGDQSWKAKPPSRRRRRHRRTSDGESEEEEESTDDEEEKTEDGNESENEVASSSLRGDANDVTASTSSSPLETVDPNFDPNEPWKNRITLLHKWTWLHLYDESDHGHGRHRLLQEYPSLSDISATEVDNGEVLVFRATLLYGAKWKETREPVSEPRLMDEINEDCETVLWDAIDDGTFLRAVGRSIEHTKDFLFDSNGIVIERYSIDDDQVNERETVVFLEIRSTDGTASSTPYHGKGEGGIFPDHTSVDERDSGTFNEPLEPEWGVREWCGVALAASTLVIAALLSASASFLSRRQALHSRWGSMFTEQGVAELLHVGWRYHDDGNMMPETSSAHPQLFLQVYDRRKSSFYNEENSMLQGGAEQEFFVPTGIAGTPTSVPTTSIGMTQTNGGRTEGDRSRTASGSGSGSLQPSTTSPSPERIPRSPSFGEQGTNTES